MRRTPQYRRHTTPKDLTSDSDLSRPQVTPAAVKGQPAIRFTEAIRSLAARCSTALQRLHARNNVLDSAHPQKQYISGGCKVTVCGRVCHGR